jgi:hypothetical protein
LSFQKTLSGGVAPVYVMVRRDLVGVGVGDAGGVASPFSQGVNMHQIAND